MHATWLDTFFTLVVVVPGKVMSHGFGSEKVVRNSLMMCILSTYSSRQTMFPPTIVSLAYQQGSPPHRHFASTTRCQWVWLLKLSPMRACVHWTSVLFQDVSFAVTTRAGGKPVKPNLVHILYMPHMQVYTSVLILVEVLSIFFASPWCDLEAIYHGLQQFQAQISFNICTCDMKQCFHAGNVPIPCSLGELSRLPTNQNTGMGSIYLK